MSLVSALKGDLPQQARSLVSTTLVLPADNTLAYCPMSIGGFASFRYVAR